MKLFDKTLALFLLVFLTFSSTQASGWLNSLEDAQKLALATDKLILVDFWATWCGPCRQIAPILEELADDQQIMDAYVTAKVDIDHYPDLAKKYNVNGIPYLFIMDGNGKVLDQQMSYKKKFEVIKLLKKYAVNTNFLRQDLVNYNQKQSYITAYRLASKYQDYCLYLDDDLKSDFLKLSGYYFDEYKKELKPLDVKNKEAYYQKIELFDIQENLILNKPEKALKKLHKYGKDAIYEVNQSFYDF
ncbi:MAG: thioredoxin fold domain-containing protein, partial [Gelidibacter sp.]|nr:thioredoxin fold domain-containing protein [Gelidibacter sp.]